MVPQSKINLNLMKLISKQRPTIWMSILQMVNYSNKAGPIFPVKNFMEEEN